MVNTDEYKNHDEPIYFASFRNVLVPNGAEITEDADCIHAVRPLLGQLDERSNMFCRSNGYIMSHYARQRTARRVGHGLGPFMGWVGLGWVGLGQSFF